MKGQREQTRSARRWVVKIGSALATNEGRGLRLESMDAWAAQIAALRQRDIELVLVSSGSVAEGVSRLGWSGRPHELHRLQAAAAVGQMGLIQAYESCFKEHGMHTAQVLLTHDDLSNRKRYLNARTTLRTLLELAIVPVVNENDTVTTDEIRFGDNDSLAGLVANLIGADLLVILTDQEGLFEADPRHNPGARLIPEVRAGDPALEQMAGEGGALGRGGMRTKLGAATLAARSGTFTVIAAGQRPRVLEAIADGAPIGTLFLPVEAPLAARKRWLAGNLSPRGRLHLDAGAARVLRESGRSLLAVGVTRVEGAFARGELVSCLDPDGREMARGLVNYSAGESRRIAGRPSRDIESQLGYVGEAELIHRDNLVLV